MAHRVVFYRAELASGDIVRITLPIVVMALVTLVTWLLMTRSSIGRQLYAMGGNPEAARRIGIDIGKLTFFAYGYLGLLAALGGMVQAHRVGESVPNVMVNKELAVPRGGGPRRRQPHRRIGTVLGTLLGFTLLAILQNGLILLASPPTSSRS